MLKPLAQKTVLITGATSGIGYQAALDFARQGACVIGVGRDQERCLQAMESISQAAPGVNVDFLVADLSLQQQVRGLAEQVLELLSSRGKAQLDVLVNNAGLVSDRKVLTADGIELTFAVNHLAPFLLTHLLLPVMRSHGARVLTVSSNSHYHTLFNPRTAWNPPIYFILWAYKVSKLSNVLFSVEFNRRNPCSAPRAYAIDPGLVNTAIGKKGTSRLVSYVWGTRQVKGDSPVLPSRTILHVSSIPEGSEDQPVYWRDSQPKEPSRVVWNKELSASLWDQSCRLCGIGDYFPGI